jgi:hypothetical protein
MTCPVCWRTVKPNKGGRNIAIHRDKAGHPCPTSGYPTYICQEILCATPA